MTMVESMTYPFAPQDRERPGSVRAVKTHESEPKIRSDAAKPKPARRTTSEEQVRLFRRVEEARFRIARAMPRYPEVTATVIPALTEKARLSLFAKTAEWALTVQDLVLTQCASPDSTPGFDNLNAAFGDMFRIHNIGDTEKEQFVAVLEDCVNRLLLVETRFDVGANEWDLSPRVAVRLKERDLKA
jgi:hypothetical protein